MDGDSAVVTCLLHSLGSFGMGEAPPATTISSSHLKASSPSIVGLSAMFHSHSECDEGAQWDPDVEASRLDVDSVIVQLVHEVKELTAAVAWYRQGQTILLQNQTEMRAQIASLMAPVDSGKSSAWICPVCEAPLAHMRSFKGHIKRFFDAEMNDAEAPSASRDPMCFLKEKNKRHVALLAHSGPGSWRVKSKEFAKALWLNHVKLLTSSDDNANLPPVLCGSNDAVPRGAANADWGEAP